MPVVVHFDYPRQLRKASARQLVSTSDGDTPNILQPIRMVSIDTPEKPHYAGNPAIAQPKLNRTRQRLQDGFYNALPLPVRQYLIGKLTADAAQRHIDASFGASQHFDQIMADRLTREDGGRRNLAVVPTGEIIDTYGRMLAYMAPWFAGTANDPLPPHNDPRRRTFNLEMIESGWAAFFPIYPSLPQDVDMNLAIAAAEDAWDNRRGQWTHGENLLLGYEFRACVKLADPIARAEKLGNQARSFFTAAELAAERPQLLAAGWQIEEKSAADLIDNAFQRHCVNLANLQMVGRFDFHTVPPPHRLWVWTKDMAEAQADLGF